jgi:hypothetical protein
LHLTLPKGVVLRMLTLFHILYSTV